MFVSTEMNFKLRPSDVSFVSVQLTTAGLKANQQCIRDEVILAQVCDNLPS